MPIFEPWMLKVKIAYGNGIAHIVVKPKGGCT